MARNAGEAPTAGPLTPLCLKWYLMLLLLRSPGGPVCSSRGPAAQRPWPGRSSPEVVRRWGRPSPSPPWDSGRLRSRLFHPLRAAPLRSDRSRRRRSPPLLSLPPCCSSCCRPSSASPPRAPAVPAASRLQAPQSRGCSSPVSQTWRAGPPAARTCASPGAGTAAGWSGSEDEHVLLGSPGILGDFRAQVVGPPLPALLPDTIRQLRRDRRPALGPEAVHQLLEHLVLMLRPGFAAEAGLLLGRGGCRGRSGAGRRLHGQRSVERRGSIVVVQAVCGQGGAERRIGMSIRHAVSLALVAALLSARHARGR
eukprot:scaffold3581_cov252-Pinguiococcus_pyrenoidosus.AAC.22